MSRTSARQQRMRQQTLDEERMAQIQIEPRASGERPNASKLIINSPTLTPHPSLNSNISGVVSHYNRGSTSSALLASLGGCGQRQDAIFNNNSALPSQSRLYLSTSVTEQTTMQTLSSQLNKSADGIKKPSSLGCSRDVLNSMLCHGQSIYQQSHPNHNASLPQNTHSKYGSHDSASPGLASTSELSTLELESHDFPTSDMNSPMESCFANIMEDQGSDSFDLNNITPSLHLSSVGVSNSSTLDYSQPTIDSSDKSRYPDGQNIQKSGIHMVPDTSATHLKRDMKMERDDDLIHSSSSCPAGMQDTIQHNQLDASSPVQSASHLPQSVLNKRSGSPLGVMIPEPASLPVAVINIPSSNRNMDDQRVAWIRDRTKKDSHNRIERKRRDYINCQISELGSLLPEDMFRDGSDSKKNKGSILKNSVEFICFLRSELAQIHEVRRETNLAAKVIGQLVKRVQELESINNTLTSQTQTNRMTNADYQNLFQEWLILHEYNLQNSNSLTLNSPLSRQNFYQSVETAGSSSPGLSSVGTEDLVGMETKSTVSTSLPTQVVGSAPAPSNPLANSSRINSPISSAAPLSKLPAEADSSMRLMRTRCTSLSVSTTGTINNAADIMGVPGIRLNSSELHTQSSNKLRLQRALQSHQSPQLRVIQSTSNCSQQLMPQSQLRNSLLPLRQLQQNFPVSQSPVSTAQQQLTGQNLNSHLSSVVGMPVGIGRNAEFGSRSCLSTSLPVNVNPFSSGLQDCDSTDDKDEQVYVYDLNPTGPRLKSDSQYGTNIDKLTDNQYPIQQVLNTDATMHGNRNTILELVTQSDPLTMSTGRGHSPSVSLASGHSKLLEPVSVSSVNFDSPTNITNLDVDSFQFDDEPME